MARGLEKAELYHRQRKIGRILKFVQGRWPIWRSYRRLMHVVVVRIWRASSLPSVSETV
jgi:hypothetical protein